MTAEDGRPSPEGGTARLFAGFSFVYAFVVTVLLMALEGFFEDDSNQDAVLLWLMVPLVSSFGTWMSVRSRHAPLRIWIWFGIAATMFFCWSIFIRAPFPAGSGVHDGGGGEPAG